ncbi:MAG: transcriptional regulator, AraC family with amidase-like domain [Gemmataceae bacterium]|nr:transcriptional regulator, AraC family with amidase-like domain [Gemmataceae bacterium]
MPNPMTVSVVAPPGVQLIDVSGPLDVFAEANAQLGREVYRLEVVGTMPGPLRSSSGVRLIPDRITGAAPSSRPDTLLVAGAPGLPAHRPEAALLDWLRLEVKGIRRYGSVCSGAFLLAAAGVLDGRRVTTHWAVADRLAREFPSLAVEKDALYVRDGPVRTAAGVTAGMDLALALVEEDVGRVVALNVAAQLVMFFKRPGGQLQFSRAGGAAPSGRSALQELQRWVAAHPAEAHTVPSLAGRVGLSTRHFARLFRSETGISPAAWVEAARVEAARGLLEASACSPKQVAARCGFADVNVLRRAFRRHVGVTPVEYRNRFR